MGSESDWPIMKASVETLKLFDVPHEVRVLSAHRTPEAMSDYARNAASRGVRVIIAGAGGAAHLPGMIAASTRLPVIGVPIPTRHLKGMDSLLSVVQMPGGVPVATVSIGGAKNAALLAAQILGLSDSRIAQELDDYKAGLKTLVAEMEDRVSILARELFEE